MKKRVFQNEEELQRAIIEEKARGTPDVEIGRKYGVTYRYMERLITRSQGLNISTFKVSKKIKRLHPKDFQEERTTVWSFKQRGNWATHSGEYRGNWSPYIPRNVILKYSRPGELVLDYFCGAGTTAVECKLLGRRCIALDINDKAIELAKRNLDFRMDSPPFRFMGEEMQPPVDEPRILVGDARDLSFLPENSIDLICSHPPYGNIIHYTDSKEGDLSFLDREDYLKEMAKVARESFRVLKPGRQCAILIGDTRRKKHVLPLGFQLIQVFLNAGFEMRELVIKRQHNCKTTGFWYARSVKYNFLLLAHEYLPIFVKPIQPFLLKEREWDYGQATPVQLKPPFQRKLEGLETTTVWIFPEKDFEKYLNKNVIERYSGRNGYATVFFLPHYKAQVNMTFGEKPKSKGLLFIQSPFLNTNPTYSMIQQYLQKTKEIVEQEIPSILPGGFIVIQTRDVRIDGCLQPLALKLLNMLDHPNLWLKEIIVLTQEGANSKNQPPSDYLQIAHQYLLVYEVKK